MEQKLVRAVVRGVDVTPKKTAWVPLDTANVQELLLPILPPAGENFTVVWETRSSPNGVAGERRALGEYLL